MAERSFRGINDAPIQGITLRGTLTGYKDRICRISWSRDGRYLATPSEDGSVRIWAVNSELYTILQEPKDIDSSSLWVPSVYCVAWSPDGKKLATGSSDSRVRVWDVHSGEVSHFPRGHDQLITSLDWSPDGSMLASASDDRSVILWEANSGKNLHTFYEHGDWVTSVAWSPDGKYLASGCADNIIRIWDIPSRSLSRLLAGHKGRVTNLVWTPAGESILSSSYDATIKFWDPQSGQQLQNLEGHGSTVRSISISHDCKILASNSWDSSIRLWSMDSLEVIGFIKESVSDNWAENLAFNPRLSLLATLSNHDSIINIWKFDSETLLNKNLPSEAVRYTTAKLILVGDSGVGKTGLGWRLAHNEFKEHSSTHGQQFWVIPELGLKRSDGTICEAVLWDLAGQAIYGTVHPLFLDNVDTALVLFDPGNRQDPLKGTQFWLEHLKGKSQLPPTILVGARIDRGTPALSQQDIEQFCQKYDISGGYIATSASSGEGLDRLVETIRKQIPWDRMAATVTTVTFKKIKEFVLWLKEKANKDRVLVNWAQLREQLQENDQHWDFTDEEMMTAVRHLVNHGYVSILQSSSGAEHILLAPDLLVGLASSIVLLADRHAKELGAINETDLLLGKYQFDELKGLSSEEGQILLDAAILRFLEHNICFRETLGNDALLIFPSLIKQKRPFDNDVPATDDITYLVHGKTENIYASLAVLIGYTPSFTRINQWQNQAQYETQSNNICGFRLVEDHEGEIELILYYGDKMPVDERRDFQALFENFLFQRDVKVTPFPPVICPNGHRQERTTVVKRSQEGKKSIFCDECGAKAELPVSESLQSLDFEIPDWLKREEAIARLRSIYETHLVRVKGHRRDWSAPRCYISHANEQAEFAARLAHDLVDAGIFVIDKPVTVEPGDNIIVIDSPSYRKAWETNKIQDEIGLVRPRLADSKHKGLIYINQAGNIFKHTLKECVSKSFCDPSHYVVNLFDLVLSLYVIPLNQMGFSQLRETLHQQWEQTLSQKIEIDTASEPGIQREIYVSYAWGGESEKLVNKIDQAFQKKGVTITRDKRDLGYKGSIKEFMERIGRGKIIIVVMSDKYLRSKNCMFELLQISENKQFKDRIFPVVLSDANIYDAIRQLEYIKYWEMKKKELNEAMKEVSAENLQGIREEIDLFARIRNEIADLADTLQDMNTLTPDMHLETDFQILFDSVMKKLSEE